MGGQGTSYKTPEAAKIGNRLSGQVIDRRGEQNFPNDPISEIDKAMGRLNLQSNDIIDEMRRGTAAIRAGWDRNPQEIRSLVQQREQQYRNEAKERETAELQNKVGSSPQSQLASSLGRIKASGLLPNTPVGPARQAAGLPNANRPLGLSGDYMGPPSISNVMSPTQGLIGPRSPMSGQDSSFNSPESAASAAFKQSMARALDGYNVPGARTVAQDPSVAGRAAQANRNYTTTSAPGGMVSRTYSDPDVAAAQQANQPSFTDRITRSLQGLNESLQSAFGVPEAGPNRGLSNPTVGQQLGAAATDAYGKIKAGAGNFIDNLLSQPMIGQQAALPSVPNTGSYPAQGSPEMATDNMGIVMGSNLAKPDINGNVLGYTRIGSDQFAKYGNLSQGEYAQASVSQGAVPPTQDEKRQQVAQKMQQERKAGSMPPANGSEGIQTGPQPEMSPEDVIPGSVSPPAAPTATAPQAPRARRSVDDVLQEIALAEAAVNGIGAMNPTSTLPVPGNESAGGDVGVDPQPNAPSSGVDPSLSPSQQGDYPPDENFMQDDGQAQSIDELGNRFQYEKDRAVDNFKNLHGNLYNAIVNGDLRPYTGTENDKRMPYEPQMMRQQAASAQMSSEQEAALITLLMSLLQQQSAGNPQADLVNNTFI